MTRVDVEVIRTLKAQIREINELPFDEIEFYEGFAPLVIPDEIRDNWKFIGMTNVDFIDTGYYKDGFSDEIVVLEGTKIGCNKQ